MAIDNFVFYTYPHVLSVSERKSCISSFTIANDLIFTFFRVRIYFSLTTLSCSNTTEFFVVCLFVLMQSRRQVYVGSKFTDEVLIYFILNHIFHIFVDLFYLVLLILIFLFRIN